MTDVAKPEQEPAAPKEKIEEPVKAESEAPKPDPVEEQKASEVVSATPEVAVEENKAPVEIVPAETAPVASDEVHKAEPEKIAPPETVQNLADVV